MAMASYPQQQQQQQQSVAQPTSTPVLQQGNPQAVPTGPNDEPGPIIKFQRLLPSLKLSLSNLMKIAGQVLQQNAVKDTANAMKSVDIQSHQQKLEKCLEDFYSLCDQVEMNLRLALEIRKQMLDSNKNTPNAIMSMKAADYQQPPPSDVHTYPQYMNIVRAQINCANEVHELLLKFSQQVVDK